MVPSRSVVAIVRVTLPLFSICRMLIVVRDPRNVVISEHRMKREIYKEHIALLDAYIHARLKVSGVVALYSDCRRARTTQNRRIQLFRDGSASGHRTYVKYPWKHVLQF